MNDIPFKFTSLKGGLNTNGNPMMIEDTESSDLDNVDFDRFGRVKKRNGYFWLNSVVIPIFVPVSPVVPIADGMPMGLLLSLTYKV